jgi:hypothetical protein
MTNSFGNKSFMCPLRRLSMYSWWALFFPFWGGVGWGKLFFCFSSFFPMCSQHFLIKFSKGSQSVPKWVPQDVPNSTSILSHTVCPEFNSHVYKLKMYAEGEHICFYFATGVQRGASIGGMANVPKTLLIGQSTWLLYRNKKKSVSDPLTN